jgi:type I restriction enzyme M protein
LRDFELVPLKEDWSDYMAREVTPFVPDAWVDQTYRDERDGEIGRVGYEINVNRYFYKYVSPRPLAEIDSELKQLEAEIAELLKEVAA